MAGGLGKALSEVSIGDLLAVGAGRDLPYSTTHPPPAPDFTGASVTSPVPRFTTLRRVSKQPNLEGPGRLSLASAEPDSAGVRRGGAFARSPGECLTACVVWP